MMRALSLVLAGIVGLVGAPAWAQSGPRTNFVTVGTGPSNGTYYPVGRALCRIIDRELKAQRIRCSAEATPGSVYNVRFMQTGEFDFALVQADVQFAALNGKDNWAGAPVRDLRSVFSLYSEVFAVIAAPESGIGEIDDLRGRRVNVGGAGSGTRTTWNALATVLNLEGGDRVRAVDIRDVSAALCSRSVDASLMVAYHPAAALRAQLAACETRLVPVRGRAIEALLELHPYYRPVRIPAATYATASDIESFGVSTDFVTTTRADPRIVTAVLRVVLANLTELATLSPALSGLDPRSLAGERHVAPLHPAAAEIYRGLGLLR